MNRDTFRHPPNILREAPFWSWNDDLQNDELERQALDMAERGWGGYFMHSRVGLITPYLSEDWFDRIKHTVEISAKAGLKAYLYDEDKWPSGYAGGIVARKNPDHRSCALQCTAAPPNPDTNTVVAIFKRVNGDERQWERIAEESQAREGEELHWISVWTEPMGNPWFNGAAYTDLMNPDAVQSFFELTLEPYAKLVGEHFGEDKAIPGIFTDEPSYMFWITKDQIDPKITVPWTRGFPEAFRKRWDYNILDEAMALFDRVPECETVRYHFYRTATELFVEAFSEPYGRWCREHNLQLTGHYMLEDDFQGQVRWIGAAMPHYEHMGWPGMDHLGRNIDNPITARQVTSVANQLGKKRTLSELYGCSGQNMSLEDRKWMADWHFVHGINLMNPHLSLYTMRGERKRDYPPTISYQQPWWRYNNLIADYTARLSYALTQGIRVPQVLVIHPIESAWCVFQPDNEQPLAEMTRWFDDLTNWLLEAHYDFDYADESLLEKYGAVDDPLFRVGIAAYEAIVVPPGVTLRSSTLNLLEEWMQRGGPVISVKPLPRHLDGMPPDPEIDDDAWDVLREGVIVERNQEEFTGALSELITPSVQVLTPEGFPVAPVWFHERYVPENEDGNERSIYFFANTDTTRGYRCTIVLHGSSDIEEWDPATGEVREVFAERAGSYVMIEDFLDAAGSRLLVQKHGEEESAEDDTDLDESDALDLEERLEILQRQVEKAPEEIELDGTWRVTRRDPNAVTLDLAYWRLLDEAEEEASGAHELPLIDDEADDDDEGWQGPSPLHRILGPVRKHTGEFELGFTLFIDDMPPGEIHLVLETPELFTITVNDEPVPDEDAGWWVDTTFRKRDITALVSEGQNTIVLRGAASDKIELESVYVIGEFGVWTENAQEFSIGADTTDSPGGDLVDQGYCFYAGTVSFEQRIDISVDRLESARLVIDGLAATVADVWVNGENAGQIAWAPSEVEIGALLKDGRNDIRIDLTNTLRNLLGPHHHRWGELKSVGPGSFSDDGNWTDIYQFVPFGMSGVRILVNA